MKLDMETDTETVNIDYAEPILMVQKHLRHAHTALLRREYDDAIEDLVQGVAEMRMAIAAIRHLRETER